MSGGWNYLNSVRGGTLGSGLSGSLDDLESALEQAQGQSATANSAITAAGTKATELWNQHGSRVNEIGGMINDIGSMVSGISEGPEKERIARASLNAMGAAANAVAPGIGSLMVAAVQILWQIVNPGLRALSAALRTPTRGESAWNYFLHTLHYSAGDYGRTYEEDGLARAFRDGWWVEWVPSGRRPFGARSLVEFYYNMGASSPSMGCWPDTHRNLLTGTIPLIRATADAVDRMIDEGNEAQATETWNKIIALTDKLMPLGRQRFEYISGYTYDKVPRRAVYPDYPIPATMEEAANPRFNRVMLGRRSAYGNTFDILGFKLMRFPPGVLASVLGGLLAPEADWPCDAFVRRLLRSMAGTRFEVPQAPVLEARLMASAAAIKAAQGSDSGGGGSGEGSSVGTAVAVVGGVSVLALLAWLALK